MVFEWDETKLKSLCFVFAFTGCPFYHATSESRKHVELPFHLATEQETFRNPNHMEVQIEWQTNIYIHQVCLIALPILTDLLFLFFKDQCTYPITLFNIFHSLLKNFNLNLHYPHLSLYSTKVMQSTEKN